MVCVNALYRASFISTHQMTLFEYVEKKECQCPVSGELHFYFEYPSYIYKQEMGVNALYRASFISTTHPQMSFWL